MASNGKRQPNAVKIKHGSDLLTGHGLCQNCQSQRSDACVVLGVCLKTFDALGTLSGERNVDLLSVAWVQAQGFLWRCGIYCDLVRSAANCDKAENK